MKRYDLVDTAPCGEPWREMEESADGDWTRYEDVSAEVIRLRADNAVQRDALERIYAAIGDTAATPTQAAEYVEKLRRIEVAAKAWEPVQVIIEAKWVRDNESGVATYRDSVGARILSGLGPDGKPVEV